MGKRQRNRERASGERPMANQPKPYSRRSIRRRMREEALQRAIYYAKSIHPSAS